MKTLEKYIYDLSGFRMPEYKVCHTDFAIKHLPAILSDNFRIIDANILENEFGCHLNNWLKVTHKVMWQIDAENLIINLYSNSINLISNDLSYELKIEKSEALKGLENVVLALAEAHLFVEKFVFNVEGNWLLKRRNAEPNDLIRYFIFWAASRKAQHIPGVLICLLKFTNWYAADISVNEYDSYNDKEMITAFIQCFYRNINEKKIFRQVLCQELIF